MMQRRQGRVTAAAVFLALEPRLLFAAVPPSLWTTQGPGGGGSYFSANLNGNDLWVASDMSGIYHSADLGANWQELNFHTAGGGLNGGTASQVVFTSDANVLYLPNSNQSVAKSSDGGKTWSKLSAWSGGTAYWMAADPTLTSKILLANSSNIYVSSNGGSSFTTAYSSSGLFVAGAFFDGSNVYVGTNKGLLVSTNGGTSFTLSTTTGIASGQYMISFTGAKAGATTRLIAITSATSPTAGQSARSLAFGKLYRLDVGGTWTDKTSTIPSGQKMHFVQMARTDINTAYLAGTDANGYAQIYKTTSGGDAWTDVFLTSSTDVGSGGVDNKNIATGYEGSGGDFNYGWGGGPWSFVVSASDPNRAMTVDSGFIHVTSDGGATWQAAYVNPADRNPTGASTPKHDTYRTSGSDDTSVHYLTWTSPTTIVAGYTDTIGWRSTDDGNSWAAPTWYTTSGNGDNNTIYKTELSADGTKLYGASSSVHDMYQSNYLLDSRTNPSYQNGRVVVSSDQGNTWSLIHEFDHPLVWEQLDPNNANRMYAMVVDGPESPDAGVAGGIWVTSNLNLGASATWTHLPSPPRTQGHPYILRVLNDGTLVATFSGRRSAASGTEVFTDSSGVFVSSDGGNTWTDRSAANMHWYTKEVLIDPTDPTQNTWWVTVNNGWSGTGNDLGDLYRTTNRGVSWTKMGLNNVVGAISLDVNSVTINPATKEMFVATGTKGVFYTPDVTVSGLSSSNFSDVTSFNHAWVERVFINPYNSKDVWVATFGGGIKRGGLSPAGLTASAVSGAQINLTWTDNSANEAGFEIDRATDSNFTQNLVTSTASANATSASITGLSAGTTYYFRVRAVGGVYKSANSSTANATTNVAFNGTSGADAYYVRRNGTLLEVFSGSTPTGTPIYSAAFTAVPSLTFAPGGGDDSIIIDGTNGDPIPGGGVVYDGGSGANYLSFAGTGTAPAGTVTLNGGNIAVASAGPVAANVALTVNAGAAIIVNASLQLSGLTLSNGATAGLVAGGGKILDLATLQLTTPSRLDLTDNELLVHNTSAYASIASWVQSGRNDGSWAGSGIITSAAPAPSIMTLGVMQTSSAVEVLFTYGGDANLDGKIDVDDYGKIDFNVNLGTSGWYNGDFNYDGKINVDDYGIIDFNVGVQGSSPAQASQACVQSDGQTAFALDGYPPLAAADDDAAVAARPKDDLLQLAAGPGDVDLVPAPRA